MSIGIPYPWERAVWSSGFLVQLDCATVYQAVFTNRQYEGEIRQSGSVLVPILGNVTITDYKGPWPSSEWESLKASYAELRIDKAHKFLVKVPDVRAQFTSMNLITIGSARAAASMSHVVDIEVATVATRPADQGGPLHRPQQAWSVGFGTGDIEPSMFIMRLRELLVDACAPMASLRAVVPSWFASELLMELGYRATGLGEEVLMQGPAAVGAPAVEFARPAPGSFVAQVYGVQIYQSAAVPVDTEGNSMIVMGDPMLNFAGAMESIETIRIENDFAWGVKGLWVYGVGLLQPETMALGLAKRGDITPFAAARQQGRLPVGQAPTGRVASPAGTEAPVRQR